MSEEVKMRTFKVVWNSEGNVPPIRSANGRAPAEVIVRAETIAKAQDKFLAWLRKLPLYEHMWRLDFQFTEVAYIEPLVLE